MKRRLLYLLLLFLRVPRIMAQALYAGTGPGSYIAVGATGSAFNSDFGKRLIVGGTLYLDANLYRRVGVEVEARTLRFRNDTGLRETTYLVGPRVTAFRGNLRPYAKILVGRGHFRFPYGDAHGSYYVAAPGAGIDYRLPRTRVIFRVVDFECQLWPGFAFGALHPYGVSSGFSIRLF